MSGMSSILQALLGQNGTDRVAAFRQLTNAQTQQLLEELRQAQNTRFGPAQVPSEPAQPAQDQAWDQSSAQQRDPWDQLPGTAPAQTQHRAQGKGRRRYEDYDAMRGPAPAPRWADSYDDGNDDWGQWHGTAQSSHGQASWEQSGGDWSYAQPAGYGHPPPAPPSEPAPAPAPAASPAAFWPLPRPRPDQPHGALTPSERVTTEIRYVRCKNGELRPVFKHSSGSVCCAIACQISSCDYGRPPCAKQIHEPWDKDVHEVHRCSKCKQAGK